MTRQTWVQVETYLDLASHPLLGSHLVILSCPDTDTTCVMYPVSTLAVDNNLLVQNGAIVSNLRRNVPGKDETVHIIFGESSGSRTELVRAVIERARRCVGGRERQPVQDRFWDGLGLCTWESFGANRELMHLLHSDTQLSVRGRADSHAVYQGKALGRVAILPHRHLPH